MLYMRAQMSSSTPTWNRNQAASFGLEPGKVLVKWLFMSYEDISIICIQSGYYPGLWNY